MCLSVYENKSKQVFDKAENEMKNARRPQF